MITKNHIKTVPHATGVYLFKDHNNIPLYIGKALDIKQRIKSHFSDKHSEKAGKIIKQSEKIDYIMVFSAVEALILEANLIKKYKPKYNLSLKDDKSFLYIVISAEEFPRVLAARLSDRISVKNRFGPFPSSRTVRKVLKTLRRVFPYCVASPLAKHSCFYSHIGYCNPCPANIRKLETKEFKRLKKIYLQNIGDIRKILKGKISEIKYELEKNMKYFSKQQDFENASVVLRKLKQVEYITSPYYKVNNFLENANFFGDKRTKNQNELYKLLSKYFTNLKNIDKIEGIDISNLSGLEACGSLVVFVGGEKNPKLYKRFKINYPKANDVQMIKEVLNRRLRHEDWIYPDLFVIDGGKPQVSAAASVLSKYGNIPVIGIAKREEKLIIPLKYKFVSLKLDPTSDALRLIQEIRDESHRFAKNYHTKLRKKYLSFDRSN